MMPLQRRQRSWWRSTVAFLALVGCASEPLVLSPPGILVRTGKGDPPPGASELGPVRGTDGGGCGLYSRRGVPERAYIRLRNNAAAIGANFVQIYNIAEPHMVTPQCFSNVYEISGIAYRLQEVAKPDSPSRYAQDVSGSCFAVSGDGLLLTANHVVENAAHVEVTFSDGTHMPARVESSSPSTDLALLRVHAGTPIFLALADDPPGLGEDVFAVGFPVPEVLGPSPKFTSGTISSTAGPQGDALFLQTSVPIQPGSSGSALVNDRGEVVGVVTATTAVERFVQATGSLPQNVNYAVKASYAKPLLGGIPTASPVATREEAIGRAQAAFMRRTRNRRRDQRAVSVNRRALLDFANTLPT